MIPDTIRCTRERAHIAGAEAVILEKRADALAPGPPPATIDDCTEDQLRALLLAQQAHDARRRYFRELIALDTLTGNTPSPFAGLG
jgi:hypothetical protein